MKNNLILEYVQMIISEECCVSYEVHASKNSSFKIKIILETFCRDNITKIVEYARGMFEPQSDIQDSFKYIDLK